MIDQYSAEGVGTSCSFASGSRSGQLYIGRESLPKSNLQRFAFGRKANSSNQRRAFLLKQIASKRVHEVTHLDA